MADRDFNEPDFEAINDHLTNEENFRDFSGIENEHPLAEQRENAFEVISERYMELKDQGYDNADAEKMAREEYHENHPEAPDYVWMSKEQLDEIVNEESTTQAQANSIFPENWWNINHQSPAHKDEYSVFPEKANIQTKAEWIYKTMNTNNLSYNALLEHPDYKYLSTQKLDKPFKYMVEHYKEIQKKFEQTPSKTDENKIEEINQFINEKAKLKEDGRLNKNKPFPEGFLDNYKINQSQQSPVKLWEQAMFQGIDELINSAKIKQSPAKADENIISKENRMSDLNEQEEKARDPKEEAFLATVHQRKVITEAMKAGNLCCLPGADGFADTTPAVNLVNGTNYHGANMLFLKEHTRGNGFPSAEYLTYDQVQKAKISNPDIIIRQGQKGVSIYVSEKNEESGEWENKSIRLVNVAQTSKPAELKAYAEQVKQQKIQEKEAYLQTQYGTGFKLENKEKQSGPDIICSNTDPVQYMGQYLAAVSMGSKFQVTKEQAAEFSQKLESTLFAKMENGHTNPFLLSKISNDASTVCKEVIKEAKMAAQKIEQPQQQQQQSQSRVHNM